MTEIRDSIIATGGSKIKNAKIDNSVKIEKRKSFLKGFFWGVLSSVIASAIWYIIESNLP
jgi:hypothetical protein